MRAQAIEGEALTYILVTPEGYDPGARYPLVVLLHGFGASMHDLVGLCPAIDATGYMYAFPNAPYAVDFGGGATGYSWSRGRPGAPSAPADGPSPEDLVSAFLDDVMERTGAAPGQVLLGGFSQGAGLALRFGLPRRDVFAGLVVLSGAFRPSDDIERLLPADPSTGLRAGRTQPIFIAHGLFDPMVPIERGRATRAFLESMGYRPDYHEYEMAHEISEELIYDLAPWIRSVLPPLEA